MTKNPGWIFKAFDGSLWITVSVSDDGDGDTMICRRVKKLTYREFRKLKVGDVVRMGGVLPHANWTAELYVIETIDPKSKEVTFRACEKYWPQIRQGLPDEIGRMLPRTAALPLIDRQRLRPNAQGGMVIERVA
jgi:hypothetical protein